MNNPKYFLCPLCNGPMNYDPYFKKFVCSNCGNMEYEKDLSMSQKPSITWGYEIKSFSYTLSDQGFNDKEKAIDAAKKDIKRYDIDNGEFYILKMETPAIIYNTDTIAENIVGDILNNMYEAGGETAEDFDISDSSEEDLAKRLEPILKDWIKDNKIKANFYIVKETNKYDISDIRKGSKWK